MPGTNTINKRAKPSMEEIHKDKDERKKQFEKVKEERSPVRRVEEKDEPLDEKPLFKALGAYTMG